MFLDLDRKGTRDPALTDISGEVISYGELLSFTDEFGNAVGKRALIFILSSNVPGSVAGYTASLAARIPPLLISSNTDPGMTRNLIDTYHPEFLWVPDRLEQQFTYSPVFRKYGYVLLKTGLAPFRLNDELALLLTTSGSTGSPKLVRHSYLNVEANARNVASLFRLSSADRAMAILPMHYTMGLSVITSHLWAGSVVLLSNATLTDREFWRFLKEQRATSFTGVPYSFEVLHKLRFFRMDLPDLNLLTQGGGKMSHDLFREYAEFASRTGKRFIATYGQTEGTARMAWLPPELAITKTGSIGIAIPNGSLSLIDDNGEEIGTTVATGELVYRGPNVTMGYALSGDDLEKGDENKGILHTGDIARRDHDGCHFIVGRKSRFLKLFGTRISLDESEQLVKSSFGVDCVCGGNDERMILYIEGKAVDTEVVNFLTEKTGINFKAFDVRLVDEIKKNEAGKAIFSMTDMAYRS